ncbi:unnamed protein product, partial [Candidula unifasciata]
MATSATFRRLLSRSLLSQQSRCIFLCLDSLSLQNYKVIVLLLKGHIKSQFMRPSSTQTLHKT